MAKLPFDLSKFKHVSSDDYCTQLQHKDGHKLTIAHKALSKDFKDQLLALKPKEEQTKEVKQYAQGGMTSNQEDPLAITQLPKKEVNMSTSPDLQAQAIAQKEAVAVPQPQQVDPSLQAKKDLYNQKLAASGVAASAQDMFGPNGENPVNPVNPTIWGQVENSNEQEQLVGEQLAQREMVAATSDMARKQQEEHDRALAQNVVNAKLGLPLVPDPGAPAVAQDRQTAMAAAADTEVAQMDQGLANQVKEQGLVAPEQQPQSQTPSAEQIFTTGYNKTLAGIAGKAQAEADLGAAQAAILDEKIKAQKEAHNKFQEKYNQLNAEREATIQDYKDGYISPEKYWTGIKNPVTGKMEGGHSKILTGIGMILAGFNPTNSPNAAIEFLKYNMNQNLEAQAKNLNSKESLLKANLQQFGNLKDAYEFSRIQMNDILAHELQQKAALAMAPQAKAAALQAAGQFQMEAAKMFQSFAANRASAELQRMAQANPQAIPSYLASLDQSNPDKAKELRARFIPGVGFANSPEDAKQLKEIQGRRTNIRTNVEKAINLVKQKGTYEALGPHNADLDMLAEQIATDMAKMQDPNSVARPNEVEAVKKNLVQVGLKTQNKTAVKQLQHFYDTVDNRANAAFRTLGVEPPNSKPLTQNTDSARSEALKWAEANPKDPRAKKILKLLGK